jgi:hypothetical protein
MVTVNSKLVNKFVITNFVLKLPLVEPHKICLLEISKPVSYALVRYRFAKVGIQLLYIAVQRPGQVNCPESQ